MENYNKSINNPQDYLFREEKYAYYKRSKVLGLFYLGYTNE